MDPQGNSTSGVGIDKTSLRVTTYDVVTGSVPAEEAVQGTATDRLWIMPSDVRLAGAEVELVAQIARETKLRSAIRLLEPRYDFLLIDCPPSLGLLTINGMTAAESCIIPLQCEFYALEGLAQLMETISLIRRHINPALGVTGIVLTMVDQRTKLSEQVAADVRAHFPTLVLETEVPRSIRLAEAPSYGQPVMTYAPGSRGAEAYIALAREILKRLGLYVDGGDSSHEASNRESDPRSEPPANHDPTRGEFGDPQTTSVARIESPASVDSPATYTETDEQHRHERGDER